MGFGSIGKGYFTELSSPSVSIQRSSSGVSSSGQRSRGICSLRCRSYACPATLAFMVTTALHFIPVIANEASAVFRSQRLRGFRYFRLNLFVTCRGVINSFRPILAGNIRHATRLGESVESRGFLPETAAQRTSLRTLKMGVWDFSLLAVLSACLISIIGLKLLYFCYANGFYYASWLRHVYTFTREVL